MASPKTPTRGFSLIDTIAAIVILSVAVPAMLWTVREAHIQRVNPTLASTARWLAEEELEDIVADRHSSTRGYNYLLGANYPAENPIAGFAGFTRTVSFNETLADLSTPGSGYMTASVAVGWTDADGAPVSLTVSTVLTEYSP